jgi:ABC-2 type transport system permease protein
VKNVLAIARRELRTAFDLPIAYVFIAAFLALGALRGLTGFFDRGVSDLRDYFEGLRFVFVLFAPAVSMRLWAEERRSGTFELLFTLPIRPWEAVLGKFLGALGLVGASLAAGVALPLSLTPWASFDLGAVFAGYLGVLLLASLQVAIGLLASALTENQIVAFVLAVFASFVLLVAGEPWVLNEVEHLQVPQSLEALRGVLVSVLARVGTGEHQDALARGVLDSRDLVYFLAMTGFCLVCNVFAVERRPARYRLETVAAIALTLMAALLAEDVASRRRARVDLTSRHTFSLAKATLAAIDQADARLTIRCYLSKDLPAEEERRKRALVDLLHEIEAHGNKNVHLEMYDPRGDDELMKQAEREGITRITRQVSSSEDASAKLIYCGVSLLYAGKPPVSIPLALYKTDLEYDLALKIKKLTAKSPQRVAFCEPAKSQGQEAFSIARSELARSYTVEDVDLHQKPEVLPRDDQTLVLIIDSRSVTYLDERTVYELDQFVMKGGSLVLLMKPVALNMQTWTATPLQTPILTRALERWGISLPPHICLVPTNIPYRLPTARGYVERLYPFFVRANQITCKDLEAPIATQVTDSFFPWVGEVASVASPTTAGPHVTVTPLVKTAPGWVLEGSPLDLDPARTQFVGLKPQDRAARTIALSLGGEIPSAFEAAVPLAKGKDPLATPIARSTSGRVIVFADCDFLRDYFLSQFRGNLDIFLNTIDWGQDESLAAMRGRTGAPPLDFGKTSPDKARAIAWAFNLFLLPILVGIAGALRFWFRRQASRRAATRSRAPAKGGVA